MINRNFGIVTSLFLAACLLAIAVSTSAQNTTAAVAPAAEIDEKSQQILNRAIEVVGGANYLNVKTVIGKGFYTTFHDGISQVPARFLDYIAYPNRERTEFTGAGIKSIVTNDGDTGWLYDGMVRKITDQDQKQIEEFKRSMRTSVENLLRGWWKKEGGKVVYVGRREAGLAKRNEAVRLTYPNGFWIEYEFGARDGLPAKIIYKRSRKNMDTGNEEEATEEDQLLKPISIDGITAPWVIDHFVNGQQSSRVNYESVQYNQPIPDSLFEKPDDVKKIK
jgi:outer membrane lipoprotein-sorting protein